MILAEGTEGLSNVWVKKKKSVNFFLIGIDFGMERHYFKQHKMGTF
jgi:hypothetical protein